MAKLVPLLILSSLIFFGILLYRESNTKNPPNKDLEKVSEETQNSPTLSPRVTLLDPPESKILPTNYHIFQSFNNCGPAALSMALSHYGINVSQQELGQSLRPHQVPGGDNDDKSVTLSELAEKSKDYGFIPYHRPNGNPEMVKLFITYDIPVITRTWTKPSEDIGHYRIIKGYDQTRFIQDDSLQNKNLWYTYEDFNAIWDKFNFEYLVLVPKDKEEIAKAILKEDVDPKVAWQKAVKLSENLIAQNPNDPNAHFNLSVAAYNTGDYKRSVEEFEKVEFQLPFRALWYQIEPIKAYYELGNYDRVFETTTRVLNNHNRAFSELYLIRGETYLKQNKPELARQEFEKAVLYNRNLKTAQEALSKVS